MFDIGTRTISTGVPLGTSVPAGILCETATGTNRRGSVETCARKSSIRFWLKAGAVTSLPPRTNRRDDGRRAHIHGDVLRRDIAGHTASDTQHEAALGAVRRIGCEKLWHCRISSGSG